MTGSVVPKPPLRIVTNEPIANAVNEEKEFQLLRDTFVRISVTFEETFRWAAESCESPIERLMLLGLMSDSQAGYPFRVDVWRGQGPREIEKSPIWNQYGLWVLPQAIIGPYRADLVLVNNLLSPRQLIIVECDGHAFHEKTREQAARDKRRDRYFVGAGYAVLHFTGSEVYRDARECAEEVLAQVKPW